MRSPFRSAAAFALAFAGLLASGGGRRCWGRCASAGLAARTRAALGTTARWASAPGRRDDSAVATTAGRVRQVVLTRSPTSRAISVGILGGRGIYRQVRERCDELCGLEQCGRAWCISGSSRQPHSDGAPCGFAPCSASDTTNRQSSNVIVSDRSLRASRRDAWPVHHWYGAALHLLAPRKQA